MNHSSSQTSSTTLDFLKPLVVQIEERLEQFLELNEGCPSSLLEAMHYSLMAGGKRLRPVLVLLSNEACGGQIGSAMPAACAVEMVHTYSLIHDDLPAMDDDDLRRGQATNHVVHGEAMAILAGDALLTLAFQLLSQKIHPAESAVACCRVLSEAAGACALVGGQVDDLYHEKITRSTTENSEALVRDLEAIHNRKTGGLMRASLLLGGIVAGSGDDELERLGRYGSALGLLFQITDDLLDEHGDESQMGKRVRKDSDRGKLTYPGVLGITESKRRAVALAERAMSEARTFMGGGKLEALAEFVLSRSR